MAEVTVRRVAIGSEDANWAGALSAALAGVGVEVAAIASEPLQVSDIGISVVVLAFDPAGLRKGVTAVGSSVGVLAIGPNDMELMLELLEDGALGYLPDDSGFSEISRAVEHLLDGHAVVPPAALGTLLRRVVERRRVRREDAEALESLTPREREVFEYAARGRDNEAIADALFISPATARTHLQRVFKKLDIHSRAEAVAFAARCGLDIEGDM